MSDNETELNEFMLASLPKALSISADWTEKALNQRMLFMLSLEKLMIESEIYELKLSEEDYGFLKKYAIEVKGDKEKQTATLKLVFPAPEYDSHIGPEDIDGN